jgi:hypothetical protein
MLDEFNPPGVLQRIKESTDVRIKHPVDIALLYPHRHRIQRIVRAASRSGSLGEPPKIPLKDRVQYLDRRTLNELVLPRRLADRTVSALRLRDLPPLDRGRVVSSPPEPVREIREVGLHVFSLGRPRLPLHSRRRLAIETVVRLPAPVDVVDGVP